MRLVDSNIIDRAELVFYRELSSVMDLARIGGLFRKQYNMRLSGEAQLQYLDVIVHNDQIAFKFDYTALAHFSIYMDRSGVFLEMEATADQARDKVDNLKLADSLIENSIIRDRETQLAETIANAIERETLVRLIEINSHAKLTGRIDFMGAEFAVRQNKPVYNLIYQCEIGFSFIIDEKGIILNFSDSQLSLDGDQNDATKSSRTCLSEPKEIDFDVDKDVIENSELVDGTEAALNDDDELLGLKEIVFEDLDDIK